MGLGGDNSFLSVLSSRNENIQPSQGLANGQDTMMSSKRSSLFFICARQKFLQNLLCMIVLYILSVHVLALNCPLMQPVQSGGEA